MFQEPAASVAQKEERSLKTGDESSRLRQRGGLTRSHNAVIITNVYVERARVGNLFGPFLNSLAIAN